MIARDSHFTRQAAATLRKSCVAGILVIATTAVACGSSSEDASSSSDASPGGDCITAPIDVVVTTGQWKSILADLAGDCANLTTPVISSAQDPHDFEPTPADLFAFQSADLVVLNGLGYDEWAHHALEALDTAPTVIEISDFEDRTSSDNPHLWNDPKTVEMFADKMTELLDELLPEAAAYFSERRIVWDTHNLEYLQLIDSIVPNSAAGKDDNPTFAATEPIYDDMAIFAGLSDETPTGYRTAALNESDPSPADLAEFTRRLEEGDIDVLIYNPQSEGSTASQLLATAEANSVPVIEATESQPDSATTFWEWQTDQLNALKAAVAP